MYRLTEKDEQGNWCLKGLPWKCLHLGEVITTTVHDRLYGALCKLKDYEDTGLSPDQIKEMDELYHEKCKEVAELQRRCRWIPVEEQVPENNMYVLMSFESFSMPLIGRYEVDGTGGAFYVGDDDEESCISQDLIVNAWMPLPEPYRQDDIEERRQQDE